MRRVRGADHIQSSLSVVLTDAAPVTHRGSGLKSTTGAYRGGSYLAWVAQGGCYIKNQLSDPIEHIRHAAWVGTHMGARVGGRYASSARPT